MRGWVKLREPTVRKRMHCGAKIAYWKAFEYANIAAYLEAQVPGYRSEINEMKAVHQWIYGLYCREIAQLDKT